MLIKRLPVNDLKEELAHLKGIYEVMPLYSIKRKIGLINEELRLRKPKNGKPYPYVPKP